MPVGAVGLVGNAITYWGDSTDIRSYQTQLSDMASSIFNNHFSGTGVLGSNETLKSLGAGQAFDTTVGKSRQMALDRLQQESPGLTREQAMQNQEQLRTNQPTSQLNSMLRASKGPQQQQSPGAVLNTMAQKPAGTDTSRFF